jgi:hypothetical protein
MSESLPQPGHAARSRVRSLITTILMILISVMIVRDIFVRRWNSVTPAASDVAERSR